MSPKISIIIPIYNAEKYLDECILSCLNQTLKEIEIICVNDCSTDESYKIIEKYAKIDKRLSCYSNKKNKGIGVTRNTGLRHAKGEYVWFVDCDDYIELNACKVLYNIANKNNLDLLRFNPAYFQETNGIYTYDYSNLNSPWPKNKVFNLLHPDKNTLIDRSVMIWLMLTKRSYIKNFSFRNCYFTEDTDYTPIVVSKAERIMCIEYYGYNYRVYNQSHSHKKLTRNHIYSLLNVLEVFDNYIQKNSLSKIDYVTRFFEIYSPWALEVVEQYKQIWDSEILKLYNIYRAKFPIKKQKHKLTSRLVHYLSLLLPLGFYKFLNKFKEMRIKK